MYIQISEYAHGDVELASTGNEIIYKRKKFYA